MVDRGRIWTCFITLLSQEKEGNKYGNGPPQTRHIGTEPNLEKPNFCNHLYLKNIERGGIRIIESEGECNYQNYWKIK